MKIEFHHIRNELNPFAVSISEIISDFYQSKFCNLPVRYENSVVAFMNANYKKEGYKCEILNDSQWHEIFTQLEKQRI